MKIHAYLSDTLQRFRSRSMNHPIGIYWDGKVLNCYQNGVRFKLKDIFSFCFVSKVPFKGILLPKDIRLLIEAQEFIDSHADDVIIVPKEFGFLIYKHGNGTPNPMLVFELNFISIKGFIPILFSKLIPQLRMVLSNVG